MKRWMIFGFVAVLLVAAGLAVSTGLVLAQEPTPTEPAPGSGYGYGRGMMMDGHGVMHTYMSEAVAAKLGITVEQYDAARAEGKTFWTLAEEKGFSQEEAQQLMIEARSEALDKAVADGAITQEQADWMKERMGTHTPGDCMGGQGGGMMGGGRGGRGMMGRGGRWNP